MLEIPILREIYWSGVVITALFIFVPYAKLAFSTRYKGDVVKFVSDILSPIFISFVMILFISGFSWIGLFVFIKVMEERK